MFIVFHHCEMIWVKRKHENGTGENWCGRPKHPGWILHSVWSLVFGRELPSCSCFFVVHRVIGSISLMISQIDHGMVGSICLQCNHCSHCNHVPRSLGRRRKMKPVPIRKINGRRLWKRNWRMPAGPAFGVILPGWYRFEVIETKFGDKRIQIHMIHTGVCLYIYI